jgi:hypothetical protein
MRKPLEAVVVSPPAREHPVPTISDLQRLAHWMDSVFQIPGLPIRVGLDSLLGLLPGLGDAATSLVSLYILHAAGRHGVSRLTMARMALNIAIDWGLGTIPILGDVFDVYWKSNQKNVELLQRHVRASPSEARRLRSGDWAFFGILAGLLIALLVGSLTLAYFTAMWLGSRLFPS